MVEAAAKRRSFTMPSVMQQLYYGGGWHSAKSGETVEIKNPATETKALGRLSTLRLAELIGPLLPPDIISVLPGGRVCGEGLVVHPLVAKVGLIGAIPTGKAIFNSASGGRARRSRLCLDKRARAPIISACLSEATSNPDSGAKSRSRSCSTTRRSRTSTSRWIAYPLRKSLAGA
jgi:acyl-CoA reductase-like NAD-dependent aldehyde dehydrogenase